MRNFALEGASVLRLNFFDCWRNGRVPTAFWWSLWLLFGLHLLLGAALGLSVDEAHYALYAAHPALSYFDHPPMVGWIQWPLVALDAPTPVLRAVPGLLWLLTVLMIYRLGEQIGLRAGAPDARQVGWWAVLAVLPAPLMHILAIGLLPDTLLMLWSVAMMDLTLRLMDAQTLRKPEPWLVLGVLLGVAGLSKYTAIFSACAVALCLFSAHGPRLLRQPWLWLALLVAAVLVSPVLIWNAQNNWVSFVYQAHHGAGSVWRASNVARFLVLQLLTYGPLLCLGLFAVGKVSPTDRWLFAFFALPFAVLAFMAGGGSSLPHWTAPAWVALAPLSGLALSQVQTQWPLRALMAVQVAACLALALLMVSGGMPFLEGRVASAESSDPPNPFADLLGWDAAGARAKQLAQAQGIDAVAVQNWTLASRIGWYARPLKVFVLEDRFDQFDLWAGKLKPGGRVLLVDWSQQSYQTPLGVHGFTRCEALDHLNVQRFGYDVSFFDFYVCDGWSGLPQPVLKGPAASAP